MATNSKELVRALFAGKPVSRPPFIPYVATAAAHFMQVSVKQMFCDPTTLANSLQACQRLFKYDGIAILLDTSLEAEACGCQIAWEEKEPPTVASPILTDEKGLENLNIFPIEGKGRIPVVLEAAKRLVQTVGRDVAMLGVITGPITLGRHLMGDAFLYALDTDSQMSQKLIDLWGKIALTLSRAYGELKFDAVILADSDLASLNLVHYPKIQPALKTLHNLINFYDAPLIILTKRVPAVPTDRLSAFLRLEADGLSLGNPISDIGNLFLSTGKLFGGCIPGSTLLGPAEGVEKVTLELLNKGPRSRFFVASEWEVPQATPALNMHKIMQVLAAAPAK